MNAAGKGLLVGGLGVLLAALGCSDPHQHPASGAANPARTAATPNFAEQAAAEVRRERETRERARTAEFGANRAAIIENVRRLMRAKDWDKAEALAREYAHIDDPELQRLQEQARDAALAKSQAAAKAAAKKQGVTIGMSREQVLGSNWGKPREVNQTTTAYGVREQWVYQGGNYLYFENGTLTAIQN